MDRVAEQLLDYGLLVARQGITGTALLGGFGLLLLLLGARGYRPAVAAFAGGTVFFAVALALDAFRPKLPVSDEIVSAGAAGLVAVASFAHAGTGAALAALAVAFLVGLPASRAVPDKDSLPLLVGAGAGAFAGGLVYGLLPRLLVPVFAAVAIGSAAWGWVGASGTNPQLFRTPFLWLGLTSVLVVVAAVVHRARTRGRALKSHTMKTRLEMEAARQREEAQRRNLGKYADR